MKRCLNILTAAVAVVVLAVAAWAEQAEGRGAEARPARGPEAGRKRPDPDRMGARAKKMHEAFEKRLRAMLTEEQARKFDEIRAAHKQAMETWRKEHEAEVKALMEKIRTAHQAGQTDKVRDLRKQMRTLQESRRKAMEGLRKQIDDLLTDEQKAKLHRRRKGGEPGGRPRQEGPRGRRPGP